MRLIVSIDVEADSQWDHGCTPSCANVEFWTPFQRLCTTHGIIPTYLVTHEMAGHARAAALLAEWVRDDKAEVGAHLHPWSTPPFGNAVGLRDNDETHLLPSELPVALLRSKLERLTEQIEMNIGVRPLSYRAGRFGMNLANARILADLGYMVDSSLVPLVVWHEKRTHGSSATPTVSAMTPFVIADTGEPGILELPLTVAITNRWVRHHPRAVAPYLSPPMRATRRLLRFSDIGQQPMWLRPFPSMRAADLKAVWLAAEEDGMEVAVMMFHSSELMPGGSPYRETRRSVTGLLTTLDEFFRFVVKRGGTTVSMATAARHLFAESPLERRSL